MKKTNKLILPATILLAAIILGGFIYVSQVSKQKSIEKQQEIKLQEDRRIEEAKAEQTKKEYIAKRKNECYNIYLQEKKNWNNVKDFSYSDVRDICLVKYNSDEPKKTVEKCLELRGDITSDTSDYWRDYASNYFTDCLENWFSKEF